MNRHWTLGEIEPGVGVTLDDWHAPGISPVGLLAQRGPDISDPTRRDGDFSLTGCGPRGRLSFVVAEAKCAPETYARLRAVFDGFVSADRRT